MKKLVMLACVLILSTLSFSQKRYIIDCVEPVYIENGHAVKYDYIYPLKHNIHVNIYSEIITVDYLHKKTVYHISNYKKEKNKTKHYVSFDKDENRLELLVGNDFMLVLADKKTYLFYYKKD